MALTFEDIDHGEAEKYLKEQFAHAGETEVESSSDGRVRRSSGISFKTLSLVFADGQTVALDIKQTGDIFAVRLNGKPLPIRAQDSEPEAIAEIVKAMDAGRARFQANMLRQRVTLPASIRTPIPKLEVILQQKHADLDGKIHDAQVKIADLKNELATLPALDAVGEPEPQNPHDPDPNFFSPDTGEPHASGVLIQRSAELGDTDEVRRGDNGAPVPEQTATTAQEDEQEAQEDMQQQYDLSKHDPVNAEADRAIAANEKQEDASLKPFAGPNVEIGDNKDINDQLNVTMYY